LTTAVGIGIIESMKAVELLKIRTSYSENVFADLVIWQVPQPVLGSTHQFKYRLAYIVQNVCVVRYDNEAGKGDHRHFGSEEFPYSFVSIDMLLADFQADIARWKDENGHS
jgi:hypothetical protein